MCYYCCCICYYFCCGCCYLGAEHQIVRDFQARHSEIPVSSALVQASGKMVLIDKLLAKLKESGHKVNKQWQ